MDVLVLGGNGFLGSHLVRQLVTAGHRVRVYDRRKDPVLPQPGVVDFIDGDLSDRPHLGRAVVGANVVFHLASTTLPKTSNDDPIFDVQSNVIGTIGLIEACLESRVGRLIFSSSGGTVYGIPQWLPMSEDHPTDPVSSYGITKLAIEKYLKLYSHLHGLEYVVLRTANGYGEGQDPLRGQGAVAAFLFRVVQGLPIQIWGDGGVVRDYIYAEDVARAFVLAASGDCAGKTFNVGTEVGTSLCKLVGIIGEVTGLNPAVEYYPERRFDVPAIVLDCERIHHELGWWAGIDLREGVVRTWQWIKKLAESQTK